MNILIISFKFNPGHFSHLVANYKLLVDGGHMPYLYINDLFNQMDKNNDFRKLNKGSELAIIKKIDAAIIWFPSLKNIYEIIKLKYFNKTKIIYIYHEPFDSILKYYQSGFSVGKIIKILLINIVNFPVLMLSDEIVLPSLKSFDLYRKKYSIFNDSYSLSPLIFDDELKTCLDTSNKNYISYIGTIAADHAFDRYVHFLDCSIKNDWFPNLKFKIATASVIPEKERLILQPHAITGKVVVIEGNAMSTEVINVHYAESLVVWNAYNRSMQSGVLPKAYMFGAAVIVQSKNANEFIENNSTGILIASNCDVNELRVAVNKIEKNKDLFIKNCRKAFLKTFYYKANAKNFLRLLG
jgi:glycosyltransferase involved in cell wall biosynthesis